MIDHIRTEQKQRNDDEHSEFDRADSVAVSRALIALSNTEAPTVFRCRSLQALVDASPIVGVSDD